MHIPGFTVRPITPDDAEAWARYICLPEVMQHTSSTARTVADLQPLLARIAAGGTDAPLRFVVQPAGSDELVASVGFHTISSLNGTAEITYDVAPWRWGQGLATALCRAATTWGFAQRGWHRIQATTLLPHLRSQAVLRRCGYQPEGLLRHFRIVRGQPADYLLFATLPTDPRPE